MGIEEIGLSDGESVDSAVDLKGEKGGATDRSPNVVLLTNKRVIHFQGSCDRRETTFVCLESIDSVEISRERKGYGAYVWGVVAFLVAAGIYSVWDQPIGRIAGALAIAAMGVFPDSRPPHHAERRQGHFQGGLVGAPVRPDGLSGAAGDVRPGERPVQSQGPRRA